MLSKGCALIGLALLLLVRVPEPGGTADGKGWEKVRREASVSLR